MLSIYLSLVLIFLFIILDLYQDIIQKLNKMEVKETTLTFSIKIEIFLFCASFKSSYSSYSKDIKKGKEKYVKQCYCILWKNKYHLYI